MFSGIIQNTYEISFIKPYKIGINSNKLRDKAGDSIAINGVCLTVTKKTKKGKSQVLHFDLSEETLRKTTLKDFKVGQKVNVERALKVADSLGGHIVQGHVDAVGTITKIQSKGEDRMYWFKAPKSLMRYIVPKGSISIDGISLTVVKVVGQQFSVAIIPFTLDHTNLGRGKVGSKINLEADVLAKYISKYLKNR